MIHMFHVYKEFKSNFFGLWDVELHIERGSFIFLTGASGAGKTTLLRLLFYADKATSGQILVGGRNIYRISKRHVPNFRREIGVIFQDFKLISNRTVYDNVALALEVLGLSKKEIKWRVTEILEYLGLADRQKDYPLYLSGGEQQRIAIARALINKPQLLLADEPTGNLDPEHSWDIINLLLQLHEAGATVLVATHDAALIEKVNKPVIQLEKGKVVYDGT
jgi:cell division transport system ATP-binding protein